MLGEGIGVDWRLPPCITLWLDGDARTAFEWDLPVVESPEPCLANPLSRRRPTTRERKRSDAENAIIKFLILSGSPLTVSGLAAMMHQACSVVSDASVRLEQKGIVQRARRSRLVFLRDPMQNGGHNAMERSTGERGSQENLSGN
jgi:hypothetical protein